MATDVLEMARAEQMLLAAGMTEEAARSLVAASARARDQHQREEEVARAWSAIQALDEAHNAACRVAIHLGEAGDTAGCRGARMTASLIEQMIATARQIQARLISGEATMADIRAEMDAAPKYYSVNE